MNTKVAEKTDNEDPSMGQEPIAQVAQTQGEVVVFKPPRLPWHNAIAERFPEVNKGSWKALVEAVYPSAKSVDAVVLALTYCKARGLDPFKRPVHIVPMWDSKSGSYIETVWPGISELRTTAFRTKQYAGCDAAEFGPMAEKEFTGEVWENKKKVIRTIKVKFPEWCRLTIYRLVHGTVCKFVGPKVLWLETYAAVGKSDLPNDMWRERSEGQLEKCAEAAALRRAFPEEIGNEYAAEEMEGRHKMVDVTETRALAAPTQTAAERAKALQVPVEHVVEADKLAEAVKKDAAAQPATIAEAIKAAAAAEPIAGAQQQATVGEAPDLDFDMGEAKIDTNRGTTTKPLDGEVLPPDNKKHPDDVFLENADRTLGQVAKADDLETTWNDHVAARLDELSKGRHEDAYALLRKHEIRLGG